MPTVRAKITCYVNGTLREKGDVFEHSGPENRFVEPYVAELPAEPEVKRQEPPRTWWNPLTWFGSGVA
jgi:hypothetical protein